MTTTDEQQPASLSPPEAEEMRVNGELKALVNRLSLQLATDLANPEQLSQKEIREAMQNLGILVDALLQQVRRTPSSSKARLLLLQVQHLMVNYYQQPVVVAEAQKMKTAPENTGVEYQMRVEMLRDMAMYCLAVAGELDVTSMLPLVTSYLDQAIEVAFKGSSIRILAQLERMLVEEDVDGVEVKVLYQQIIAIHKNSGGSDRVHAVLAETLGRAMELQRLDIIIATLKDLMAFNQELGQTRLQAAKGTGHILAKRLILIGTKFMRQCDRRLKELIWITPQGRSSHDWLLDSNGDAQT